MIFRNLVLIGLFCSDVAADNNLRRNDAENAVVVGGVVHLDLEIVGEGGERELFPLMPGVDCPPGARCHTRNIPANGMTPMGASIKANLKTPLAASFDWNEFNRDMDTVVTSSDFCTRRNTMARAAGLIAGVASATVSSEAYAAQTNNVLMGSEDGLSLVFVPEKITICKGDTVNWVKNQGLSRHNVVFDTDGIPRGVSSEKFSMGAKERLKEEGLTFARTFKTRGAYNYYCTPHKVNGMVGLVTVR